MMFEDELTRIKLAGENLQRALETLEQHNQALLVIADNSLDSSHDPGHATLNAMGYRLEQMLIRTVDIANDMEEIATQIGRME
jgi:hypothetical protein